MLELKEILPNHVVIRLPIESFEFAVLQSNQGTMGYFTFNGETAKNLLLELTDILKKEEEDNVKE